jgi:peptidoglycan/xylan/chitin deacetylase (PgdA/CDA1 family)
VSDAAIPVETAHERARLFFLYHELREGGSDYSYVVSRDLFERHLELFVQSRGLGGGLFPEITFDDGHISNITLAAPLLTARGISATFFITVGWTGVKPGYMDWPDLHALHKSGFAIGAHGSSHTLLTHCTPHQLESELVRPRLTLEDKLGAPITLLSLPGGRSNQRVLAACAAAGYTHIYTSTPKPEPLPFGLTLGRLNIRGDMQPDSIAHLLEPGSRALARIARTHRLKTSAQSLLGDRLYARLWALANRQEADEGVVPGQEHRA